MAGETIITVVGNLTDDPDLRFTPSGAAVANFTVASTPRIVRPADQRVERRRHAVPALLGLAAGGRERRRVAAARHAGDRAGPAQAALLRDPRGREAHGLRDRRRRGRRRAASTRPPRSPRPPAQAAATASPAVRRRCAVQRRRQRPLGARPAPRPAAGRRRGRQPTRGQRLPAAAPTSRRSEPSSACLLDN